MERSSTSGGAQPSANRTVEYPNCFGCGGANPSGLRLVLRTEDRSVVAEFTPERRHEGWPGIVHGGVIAALLYEVMENWPYLNGTVAMMRHMRSDLVSPAKVGEPLRAESWLLASEDREMSVAARLTVCDRTIANGTASLVALGDEQRTRLGI